MDYNTTIMDRPASVDFTNSSTYHDRIFNVGDKKFYVFSPFLSMWSEHFRRMFEGDFAEAKQNEIDLKEVEAELFHKYLMVIYKNNCPSLGTDLVPLIHLSYRFLTPHVLDFCKKFIDDNLAKLGPIRLELLRTACLYDNKDLKFYLSSYIYNNLTYANCVDFLESSVKLDLQTLQDDINTKMNNWQYFHIPRTLIIELTKAAIKHDLPHLKNKLRYQIKNLCTYAYQTYDAITETYFSKNFLEEYYTEIKELQDDVKDFIILSCVAQI